MVTLRQIRGDQGVVTLGSAGSATRAGRGRSRERGQVVVLFALMLPVFLGLGAIVITLGNWFVHAKHLQTKADAAVFAGGGSWGFPCGSDIDLKIEAQARTYVGPHMKADATPYVGTTFNPQVGGVGESQIHAVLNGSAWYDDDSNPFPLEKNLPANTSICESKVLDVKITEDNSFPLFSLIPFFPDIKRKARVQIEEIDGLTGLLPIAVRLPQPLSVAAVFYDEDPAANGQILAVRYFRNVCTATVATCIVGTPAGVGQWTTLDDTDVNSWASFAPPARTGVVIATSFRPACDPAGEPAPCFEDTGFTTVNELCNQGTTTQIVRCYDAAGNWPSQSVQPGLHFIRGYPGNPPAGTGPPELRSAYIDNVSCPSNGYFNSDPANGCQAELNVVVDLGSLSGLYPDPPGPPPGPLTELPLRASDVEVRYRLVRGDGTSSCDYSANCDLLPGSPNATGTVTFSTSGTGISPHLPITPFSGQNAVAIQIKFRNATNASDPDCTGDFTDQCRWFYTGDGNFGPDVPPTNAQILAAPVQRSFMGDIDRTGAIKWLRLTTDTNCNGLPDNLTIVIDGEAASQRTDDVPAEKCFFVDMGLQGGLAQDQDEPPIALNLGTGSSNRALIDCDPVISNIKSEIVAGCGPFYSVNKFTTDPLCPGPPGFFTVPKPAPFEDWPPYRCVLTQTTGGANQIIQGFNERVFGVPNNANCPMEGGGYTKGRNYWHRDNNTYDDDTFAWDGDTPNDESDDWGNELYDGDPRLVTLFFTTYDSFTDTGNETYAIAGFGNFYVTGWGRTSNGGWQGGAPDDPCDQGNNVDNDPYNGNGNLPPPDLDFTKNTTWVWGHFVNNVQPNPFTSGGSGVLCQPEASFQPCVAVLVE